MNKLLFILLVMIKIFTSSSLFSNQKDVKIYDCFLFFNEFDILEIRLNELYDEVDYFVLVENPLTFSGNEKPLYFEENKKRFSKFSDKIIHIISQKVDTHNPWIRERCQRDDILLGLKGAKNEDVIIISDVDEIIKKEKIKEIKKMVSQGNEPMRLSMKLYRYFLNRRDIDIDGSGRGIDMWALAVAGSYKTVKEYSPEWLRVHFSTSFNLNDVGWHFTSLGWSSANAYKLESWSHQERNTNENKDPYVLLTQARKGELVEIDETYPKFILNNIEYFKEINFIDDNFQIDKALKVFDERQSKLEN
jgi:beta-1,4-mannosyl-glycoprotein beta-1,4-N-acetylglucosaminyltransferase